MGKRKEDGTTCPLLLHVSLFPSTKLAHLIYHLPAHIVTLAFPHPLVRPGHCVRTSRAPAVSLDFLWSLVPESR